MYRTLFDIAALADWVDFARLHPSDSMISLRDERNEES